MLVENNTTASTATTVYITLTNGNNGSSMMLSTPKNGIMKRAMPNPGASSLDRDDLSDPTKVSNKPVQKFMVSISATNSPTFGRRNPPPATPPIATNHRTGQKNDQQMRNLLFKDQLRQKIDELTLNDLKLNLKNIFPDNKCNPDIDNLTPRKAHSTPDLMQRIDDTCGVASRAAEKKRQAKRVMFADDRGFQLVTIRILSEPRDFSPNFRYQEVCDLLGCGFYSHHRGRNGRTAAATSACSTTNVADGDNEVFAASSPAPKPTTNWQCMFKQPASDYMAFRRKLDQNKVALENVLIKNDESNAAAAATTTNDDDKNSDSSSSSSSSFSAKMTGTIKVKNMSFEKSVVLRLSTDQWSTFVDRQCKYKPYRKVQQNGTSAATVRCPDMYDTFDFEIDLKNDDNPQCSCVQFCVKYSSNGVDYWDSNDGVNFRVENVPAAVQAPPAVAPPPPTAAHSPVISGLNRGETSPTPRTRATFRSQAAAAAASARSRPINFPIFQASSNFCPILEQRNDAFCLQMNNWTQFASWSHLSSDAPYW